LLLLISAPSGGGKTTVCQRLLETVSGLARAVTCTTREPRAGERDGVDYHFLKLEDFEHRVAGGEFLEHAHVYGRGYGTLRSEVFERFQTGQDVLLNVDVQGAASVRALAASDPALRAALVTVFMTPASISVLEARLRRRGKDAEEVIGRRLAEAEREIGEWPKFDYLVISTTIEEDRRRVAAILESERMRTARTAAPGR
jgi:guanylate kinase